MEWLELHAASAKPLRRLCSTSRCSSKRSCFIRISSISCSYSRIFCDKISERYLSRSSPACLSSAALSSLSRSISDKAATSLSISLPFTFKAVSNWASSSAQKLLSFSANRLTAILCLSRSPPALWLRKHTSRRSITMRNFCKKVLYLPDPKSKSLNVG